jgi:hypothetical protein
MDWLDVTSKNVTRLIIHQLSNPDFESIHEILRHPLEFWLVPMCMFGIMASPMDQKLAITSQSAIMTSANPKMSRSRHVQDRKTTTESYIKYVTSHARHT